MAWLHGWVALLPGWLLFVIFLFGTAAFFQQEISRWMRPELHGGAVTPAALYAAEGLLAARAPHAASWAISFPPARGGEPLTVSWEASKDGGGMGGEAQLDPTNGMPVAMRDTRGGAFLYRFHFELYAVPRQYARTLVCVAALAMLVAILSGIVAHKRIFADFFTLRLGRGQRSWLDAHNMTAVFALPFHLMITYTGLAALLSLLMPWAITANYPSLAAFSEDAYPWVAEVPAKGQPAEMVPLRTLVARAGPAWPGAAPSYLVLRNPGDTGATLALYPPGDRLGGDIAPVRLSAVTGAPLAPQRERGAASAALDTMVDLHTGLFAQPVLRWLYFLSGAAGTAMVAAGLILWTVKRRARLTDPARPFFLLWLVERLNIGVIAGAPAGIAVYFLANRLLPLALAHRADWEVRGLFYAWGAVLMWAIARPVRQAWVEALALCALLYALVPLVSAATTTHGLVASFISSDWLFAGFDLAMLATAAGFGLAAWLVGAGEKAHRGRTELAAEALG